MRRPGFLLCWLPPPAPASPRGESRPVSSGTAQARRFSAVARFGGCAALLIRPAGAPPRAPAHVLTAGHCIDLGANDVIVDRAGTRRTAVFRYLHDVTAADRLTVTSRRVACSTMKRLDLAAVEPDATLDDPAAAGIEPMELDAGAAAPGEQVEGAGIPSVGIPRDEIFLRASPCAAQGVADRAARAIV